MNVIALDIGGTKIYAGRYNQTLEVEAETKVPTESDRGLEVISENIIKALEAVKNDQTQAVGISWAGFVDREKGKIMKAPNIPALDQFELTDFITKKTGLPAYLENDARAFAFGARARTCPESPMCLGIIIGTGVGSGLIANGEILYGAHGFAGEIGHITRQEKEIETWLAGPGLKDYLNLDNNVSFSDILPAQKTELLTQIEKPLEVFTDWLAGLVLTFDPDNIVFGGGSAYFFWRHFEAEITDLVDQKLEAYPHNFTITFYNEDNAGARGAAALALKKSE